jgi:hypothetical protein
MIAPHCKLYDQPPFEGLPDGHHFGRIVVAGVDERHVEPMLRVHHCGLSADGPPQKEVVPL